MGVTAFDHPVLSSLVGDEEVAALLGPDAEMAAMVSFETALAAAEAENGIIPADAARAIASSLESFSPDVAKLREATARDGVVVPELVRQMRSAVGRPHDVHVHFGATSQDVIDTALVLRIKPTLGVLEKRLQGLSAALEALESRFGGRRLMGRTRMQAAIEITVGDRIESWRAPLARCRGKLQALAPELLVVQFGGAAGTLETLGAKGPLVRRALADKLQLGDAPQWHSQRDRLAELGSLAAALTGSLGKIGQDVALMAAAEGEVVLSGGGGSSAMPHKQNPVGAELLVALARFNAVQVSGMHQSLVHENERSGAAWTLEWLILPQMLMAAATATRIAGKLIASIGKLGGDAS